MARPNIVFIVADDLGFADLGCYGGRVPVSPVLDRLAADGLRLTQGYANSPVCSPTRFALMTGALPVPPARRRRGADQQQEPRQHDARPAARASDPAVAAARQPATAPRSIGKWHLGYPPAFGPLRSGYDEFFGPMSGGVDYFSHCDSRGTHDLWQGESRASRGRLPHRPDLAPRGRLHRARRARPARRRSSSASTTPRRTGRGRRATTRGLGRRGQGQPLPSARRQHPHLPPHDRAHGRRHRLDHGGARARTASRDDTLVVFTSDNGGERFSDNWPLVGGKMDLTEGGIRVPWIAQLAGADRGRRRQRAALHDDGLDGDDARRRRRRRRSASIRSTACRCCRCLRRAGAHVRAAAPLAHEPPRPARAAARPLEVPARRRPRLSVRPRRRRARARQPRRRASRRGWRRCAPTGRPGTRPCRRSPTTRR